MGASSITGCLPHSISGSPRILCSADIDFSLPARYHFLGTPKFPPCVIFQSMTDQDQDGLIILLLQEGSLRHAIELYHEEAGVSWEEATEAVADLARRHGIPLRRRRVVPWLVAGLAALVGSALVFQA